MDGLEEVSQKRAPVSPLASLRREGATPPSTPPHSWWQTNRPASAASTEWFEGEAARPPSRQLMRSQSQRVYASEGGLCGSLLGTQREPPVLYPAERERERAERSLWAQPKMAARATLKAKKMVGSRSMTLPADFVKWDKLPAGVSTMAMDQPPASRHLAYSRFMGHALPWRGTAQDGMVLQGGSFGKMLRSNLCKSKESKLRSASFNPEHQSNLIALRRVARAPRPTLKAEDD